MGSVSRAARTRRAADDPALRRSEFGRRVRDALLHLHDRPHLQTHPLAVHLPAATCTGAASQGRALHLTMAGCPATGGTAGLVMGSYSVALIVAARPSSPEALIPVRTSRTVH